MSFVLNDNVQKFIDKKRPKEKSGFGKTFLDLFSIANPSRLELVEAEIVADTLYKNAFLPRYFGIFGLIYIPRLIYDFSSLVGETIDDMKDDTSIKSFFKKFGENLHKDRNRASRMANDIVWGPGNLACLIVSPFISMALTIAGVTYDSIHELALMISDLRHHKNVKKMEKELEDLRNNNANGENNLAIDKLSAAITAEKKQYKLADNTFDVIVARLGSLGLTLLFSVGIAMTFFPPTAIPGAFMLCASIAIGGEQIIKNSLDFIRSQVNKDQDVKAKEPLTTDELAFEGSTNKMRTALGIPARHHAYAAALAPLLKSQEESASKVVEQQPLKELPLEQEQENPEAKKCSSFSCN